MNRLGVLALSAAALAFGSAAAAAAAPVAPVGNVAGVPRVPFRDLGPAPASLPVHLAVVLHYRNESQLQALVAQQPDLMAGHRVLTAQQFRDYFSPSMADYQRTEAAFVGMGFHVVKTYANRTVIDVAAPASVVNHAFDTDVHSVVQAAVNPANGAAGIPGGIRYANVRPATLPAALRGVVYGVVGFDNLRVLKPTYVFGHRGASHNVALGPPLQGPDTGLGPYAFAKAYDFPVQHPVKGGSPGQTYDGTGQATAVVIDSDYTESDLTAFLKYFNVTRTGPPTSRILIQGGPTSNFDSVETTLDVETIVGTTPGTALYLYLPDSLSYASIIDAYNQVDTDDFVGAVDSSFGGCETFTNPSYFPQITDFLAMQGALLGINYSASTGDSGTFECTFPGPGGVSTPASGPHFVAAGGTTLFVRLDGSYTREFGWSGSGGGVSALFAKPAYQNGIYNAIGKTRNLPDVSFAADPGSGAAFYYGGAWQGPLGGTSLSSPLVTALLTQYNQLNGTRLGDVHPLIYNEFKSHRYGTVGGLPLFRDVIGGNNGYYNATVGYDDVTGIGSIEGWGFATAAKL